MEEIKIAEFWLSVVNFLAKVLLGFKGITGSYGLSIILLTVSARLLMLPLTIKQNKSMKDMQRIQPEIKKIQEKHKDNKQKQQEEHMKLLSEHGVNPLGGCLPMVLQMPIFLALYGLLRIRTAAELKIFAITAPALATVAAALNSSSFLGVSSLGASMQAMVSGGAATAALIPYGALVVLMVLSQFFYSKAMGSSDPSQARIMNIMLIMMAYFAYIFPAGLIIYWVTGNIIGIGEHYLIARIHPAPAPATEGAKK